ncbi:methyltransferase domain-containing protein [Bermanella sp. WJH001]|uniref:methyltransferase domain-containing protein n=1 Tax=Bermanella sp. WJH001 TaxID=3048005 RepID=UPI0024BE10D1|nr:methyltransferase domain-containing protein [Bermanella sp. WJH001]MDJ1536921.1 methyltransferase domain-containing protein [Bermanella sp. WJH001]
MLDSVKDYYGKVLQGSQDLQTNACCTDEAMPEFLKPILSKVHDEVMMRYYGCGLVVPEQMAGLKVLDLGCGAGRDVYALSAMVGESGRVVGLDMTDEQLAVAREYQNYHADIFGFKETNVEFIQGDIDQLENLPFEDGYFDLIVSNCVINLVQDKQKVLKQAYRLLKQGGEMYFSDVYCDRRIPDELVKDEVLYGECLSGALYWRDFLEFSKAAGFTDPRLVKDRVLTIENAKLEQKIGHMNFYSATYRLFKIDGLESACEDYGQAVRYKGTIEHQPYMFMLDNHHKIETGKMFSVCGNTYRMLNDTRFAEHFEFFGDWSNHFGIFPDCGTPIPFATDQSGALGGACC